MTLDEQIISMEELLSDDYHWSCENAKSEYRQLLEWLKDYKQLLEMPKGDLISREALKKEFDLIASNSATGEWFSIPIKHIKQLIDNAPTVSPLYAKAYKCGYEAGKSERPQGEWIIVKDERYGDNVKCPFCGKELAGTDLNFCCKCGADMRGGTE